MPSILTVALLVATPLLFTTEDKADFMNACYPKLPTKILQSVRIAVCECTMDRVQTLPVEDALATIQQITINCAMRVARQWPK